MVYMVSSKEKKWECQNNILLRWDMMMRRDWYDDGKAMGKKYGMEYYASLFFYTYLTIIVDGWIDDFEKRDDVFIDR